MEKVSFTIDLKEKVADGLKKIITGFAKAADSAHDFQQSLKKTTSTAKQLESVCSKMNIPDLNALQMVAERVCDGFVAASESGIAFEQSIADLQSITGIAGKDLESLRDSCRRLGVESGLGAAEAARSYSLLASQIEISKIGMDGLNTLQERAITLAQASGMSMEASANALAGTINQFGLSAEEADRVINVLAAGSKYGAAEIEDLSMSFKVVGAAASAMGLTVESTAGALEILSQANLKGSEAGTALRNIILKLNTELGVDLGETSLSKALEKLKPKLSDATYLSKVFGMENIAAAQFLIQNAEAVDEMTAQLTDTNVAQEQAAIRTETNAHKLAQMRAQVEDLKISMAEWLGGMAPLLTVLSENAVALLTLGKAIQLVGKSSLVAAVHEKVQTLALKLLTSSSWFATAGMGALTAATIALYAALTLGISLVVMGIVAAFSALGDEAEQAQRKVNEAFAEFKSKVDAEISGVDTLFRMLKSAKEGTEAYRVVKQKIIDKYGTYLNGLNEEIRTLRNVEGAYLAICVAAKQAAKERAIADLNTQAHSTYGENRKSAINNLETHLKSAIQDSNIVDTLMELVVRDFDSSGKISDATRDLIFQNIPGASYNGNQMSSYATPRSNAEHYMRKFEKSMGEAQQALDTTLKESERMFGLSMNEFSGFTEKQAKAALSAAERLMSSGKATGNWRLDGSKSGIEDITGTNEAELQLVINKLKEVVNLKATITNGNVEQTQPTKDKAWYEQEKQAAEKELDALTEVEAKGKKGAALRTKIANYKRIIDTTWGTGNKNTGGNSKSDGRRNAVVNAHEQYDEQMSGTLASWDSQIADLNVASMEEGTDKEIAQIKRDAERKRAALDDAISELVAKKKEQEKALWLSQNPDKAEADWKPQKSDAEYAFAVISEKDYAVMKKYHALRNKINAEEAQRLKAYEVPGRVEELNTLSELGKAISYYEEQQSRASGAEVVNIQRTIDALRAKEDALKRLTELPGMEKEVADLGKLGGKQLKMELELIGVDGIKGKIRDLQKMLDDTENPLNDNERKVVSGLISEWRGYEVQLRKSQLKMTDAWDNIKGIGNGVTGLTETLRGNGTAWEKIVGVVDGVIGLYQSFSGIVGIISLLTQTTQGQAVAEGVKATATLASAGAETTATTAEVTASGITTAAITAETSAWSALAAAKTFAAHAFMPFVGTGIAAGYIATQQAVIAAAAIPKFANGGLIYGPTLGLMGEYAGASRNPEVIAPLDKLRAIIGDGGNDGGGTVDFKIRGRRLEGVLKRENTRHKRI